MKGSVSTNGGKLADTDAFTSLAQILGIRNLQFFYLHEISEIQTIDVSKSRLVADCPDSYHQLQNN